MADLSLTESGVFDVADMARVWKTLQLKALERHSREKVRQLARLLAYFPGGGRGDALR
ncbi:MULTISPECIES: hypothetical protein [unclassified Xanthobacter]|uniref:hypothetical protein n=1 Tax=unclassified Xanthobacter TaxID=2623496 RepID=UPI001F34A7D2|nr:MULTISPECIES: hypothetical protein [unclassified Xanthobacter]